MVDTLLDIGMKLVETLDPQRGSSQVSDPIQAYCRLSRSLRLTMMLESRLATLAAGGARVLAAERSLAQAAEEADDDKEDEGSEPVAARGGSIRVERDREAPDEIARYLKRPLTELAAAICRDLGLPAAEARDVEAAFASLTANDDAPEPGPAKPAAPRHPREDRRRQAGVRWKGSRSRPPDLPA